MVPSGQLLRIYREMRNLAPEVLADLLDLNYRTYLKIENGQRDLRVTEMIKLSEKLDIPPEWLYTQNSQKNWIMKETAIILIGLIRKDCYTPFMKFWLLY